MALRHRRLLVAATLILLLVMAVAYAFTVNVTMTTSYSYKSNYWGTYVKWGSTFYATEVEYNVGADQHINFTSIAFGSASNPAHTFGAVMDGGNITLYDANPPSANAVLYSLSCSVSPCYPFYYFPKTTSTVSEVDIYTGGSTQVVRTFVTTQAAFNAGPPGTVLLNVTGGYAEAKVAYNPPTTVTWITGSNPTITVSYSISGGGTPTAPTFTYYSGGTQHTATVTTTPTPYTVDYGSTWSITPNPLTGSGTTERWATDGVTTGTATASITVSPVYYNQYGPNVAFTLTDSYTLKNAPIFTYVLYGQTATATMSKTPTQVWIDSGSKWSAQSPFVTNPDLTTYYGNVTSGTVSGATHITEAYTTAKSCVGSTPLISLEHGCVVPAILGTWGNFFGTQIWLSFVLLAVNVAIFNKTQSIMIALSLLMVVGAVFGFAFPTAFASIAEALAAIALAGIVTKAVLMIR